MKNLRVEFEIPSVLASQAGLDTNNIGQEARRMLSLFLYEHHFLSLGKACELGGLSLWAFSELNRHFKIPINYTPEDLKDDLEKLSDV